MLRSNFTRGSYAENCSGPDGRVYEHVDERMDRISTRLANTDSLPSVLKETSQEQWLKFYIEKVEDKLNELGRETPNETEVHELSRLQKSRRTLYRMLSLCERSGGECDGQQRQSTSETKTAALPSSSPPPSPLMYFRRRREEDLAGLDVKYSTQSGRSENQDSNEKLKQARCVIGFKVDL